jgi:hypothetical protein
MSLLECKSVRGDESGIRGGTRIFPGVVIQMIVCNSQLRTFGCIARTHGHRVNELSWGRGG